jgi:hypothetical protein
VLGDVRVTDVDEARSEAAVVADELAVDFEDVHLLCRRQPSYDAAMATLQ